MPIDAPPLRFLALGRCALCGHGATRPRFTGSDSWHGGPGRFDYRTCDACGTVFQDPQVAPEDVPRLYPQSYYTHEAPPEGAPPPPLPPRSLSGARDRWREAVRRGVAGEGGPLASLLASSRALRQRAFFGLTDELIPRPPDRRALEVGSGAGHLLELLVRAGWPEVEGVDFDAEGARVARARSGRPVQVAAFPGDDLPASAFDLVVLVHAFEHLGDPSAALARLRALLAPRGRAVIIGPNPRSLGARLYGPSWVGWDPPRHLVVPPIAALEAVAPRHGLRVSSRRTRSRYAEDFAFSRAWKAGRAAGEVTRGDRRWRRVGSALASVGSPLGEEMVVVLVRAD